MSLNFSYLCSLSSVKLIWIASPKYHANDYFKVGKSTGKDKFVLIHGSTGGDGGTEKRLYQKLAYLMGVAFVA